VSVFATKIRMYELPSPKERPAVGMRNLDSSTAVTRGNSLD